VALYETIYAPAPMYLRKHGTAAGARVKGAHAWGDVALSNK
jgi:hypothetical protein